MSVLIGLCHFITEFEWWRRLRGGRWECWWVGAGVNDAVWLRGENAGSVGPGVLLEVEEWCRFGKATTRYERNKP